MFAFNGAAMARSAAPGNMKNSSAAPGKIKKRWKGPKFQQCEVLHSYTINDTEVTVIAAVQHELGATWTLEIDGLRYQLLAQGQTVLLISEQDGLVAGWTSGGEEAVVFDAEGLLEHDGTLSVVAEFYDEVVAALLDPAFINTLGQNSFSSGNRNPWILEPFFVASCLDISVSGSTTDENGCSSTTSSWSVGWDCEMPGGVDNGEDEEPQTAFGR